MQPTLEMSPELQDVITLLLHHPDNNQEPITLENLQTGLFLAQYQAVYIFDTPLFQDVFYIIGDKPRIKVVDILFAVYHNKPLPKTNISKENIPEHLDKHLMFIIDNIREDLSATSNVSEQRLENRVTTQAAPCIEGLKKGEKRNESYISPKGLRKGVRLTKRIRNKS